MIHIMISAATISFSLGALAAASVRFRWLQDNPLPEAGAALLLWLIWLTHLSWALRRFLTGNIKRYSVILGIALVLLSIAAVPLVSKTGSLVRQREVQMAIKSGLQKDCASLLSLWTNSQDRIFRGSPEYEKLPSSIRMFQPCYVTNDHAGNEDIPPHVGICTCGFGGFAYGLRIFGSDVDAERYFRESSYWFMRIANGVYICAGPT